MDLSLRTRLAIVLPCMSVALAAGQAAGQQPFPGDTTQFREEAPRITNSTSSLTTRSVVAGGPLLDAPVVRSTYQLGPGDLVDVAIFGEMSMLHLVPVTPEGTLVIPSVGVVRVLGLNLDQAQARVRDRVNTLFRNVDVTLTLSQVRSFKVFVLGDVPSPGVRAASSATRVSEIISSDTVSGSVPQRRNVLLRRSSGDTVLVDLARFAFLGDLSANPTVREGDALLVPPIGETVTVRGRVPFPGEYAYRSGESLAELLQIATGGRFPADAADTIRVSRVRAGGVRQVLSLPAADAIGTRGAAFRLQPLDAVYIPQIANYGVQYVATVRGQVARPGTYPIRPDTTTIQDLVAMAGGFTPRASLVGATLRRDEVGRLRRSGDLRDQRTPGSATDGPGGNAPEDVAPDSVLSPEERQIASITRRSDANVVIVDFERLFAAGGDPYDQLTRPGDLLTIPERQYDVAVLGAVGRPGLVAFEPARSVDQYVNLAGGYSRRADRRDAMVIRAGTGSRVLARDVSRLEPGDRLVVPFRRRRTVLESLQTTQVIVGTISGIAITVATLVALL